MARSNRTRRAQLFFSQAQKEAIRRHSEPSLFCEGGFPCGKYLGAHLLLNIKTGKFVEYTGFMWLDNDPPLTNRDWPLTNNDPRVLAKEWEHYHDAKAVDLVRENEILPVLFALSPAHLPLEGQDSVLAILGARRAMRALRIVHNKINHPDTWPTFYKTSKAQPFCLPRVLDRGLRA